MRSPSRILPAVLLLLGVAAVPPPAARAQGTPETPITQQKGSEGPSNAAESGTEPAPPPETAPAPESATPSAALPPGADPAALARRWGAERRVLGTGAGEFGVIVTTAGGDAAAGTLVLLPADGQFPGASPGIARLREEMPTTGWATWLVELEAPPRVQSLGAAETPAAAAPADGSPPPADGGKPDAPPEQPAADAAKPAAGSTAASATPPADTAAAGGAPAAETAEPAVEAPGLALDKRLGEAHAQWIDRNRARVAAALAEAAKAGPVVLVAEGSASPVLVAALDKAEGLAALVLLAPVPLDEAPFAWPEKLPLPVLEVLEPGASPEDRAGSRERAHAAGVGNHRLMLLALDGPAVGPRESLLTRRVRGWLRSLSPRDGG